MYAKWKINLFKMSDKELRVPKWPDNICQMQVRCLENPATTEKNVNIENDAKRTCGIDSCEPVNKIVYSGETIILRFTNKAKKYMITSTATFGACYGSRLKSGNVLGALGGFPPRARL